ncbi:hypothetical protein AB433_13945 [Croceicoccus naphthovorans]|uniref:Uncharacterized protein n=2 Tax=Croceicoccus naphthovorans TaxID=1348774 RepID=A0A0G3XH09_9SPHN|nr:hypothetical protein AB433_13945 [Croceicoccus naphthovorans]
MVWGRLKAPLQISPSEKTGADVVTLIAIRERAGPPNAFSACKNLQRVVQTKPGNPAKPVLRIYLPALSDDGKSALMIVSQEWSQQPSINDETSGLVGGFIVKLTRDADQEWRAKAMQQLWMP